MLEKIDLLLWGYGTIALIILTGVFFSVKIGFLQFRLPYILRNTLFAKKSGSSGEISRFQALSTALAASMGTGNIVGVAAAIGIGGPGAVFWMWFSAFFGMGTAYAENYLGVLYKNKYKTKSAGALSYLEKGLGSKPLAIVFAAATVLASFGVGNMTQANAMASAMANAMSNTISSAMSSVAGGFFASGDNEILLKIIVGIITAIAAGSVIIGGAKRIAAAAEKIIPIISLFYIVGALIVIIINYKNIPGAFMNIITGAFGIRAVGGGISGVLIKRAVSIGLRRGIFSNEAGMGSSVFVHTETDCKDGAVMGMWAMLEVFIDTIICCSITAFVILCTKTEIASDTLSAVSSAFEAGIGQFAGIFVNISVAVFVFATILGWSFYGVKAINYLTDKAVVKNAYIFIYIALIAVGAAANEAAVWQLSDIFNALMLIPNLLGILYLSNEVKKP
jgi:AGCS family alanine or glycine:cation symporter